MTKDQQPRRDGDGGSGARANVPTKTFAHNGGWQKKMGKSRKQTTPGSPPRTRNTTASTASTTREQLRSAVTDRIDTDESRNADASGDALTSFSFPTSSPAGHGTHPVDDHHDDHHDVNASISSSGSDGSTSTSFSFSGSDSSTSTSFSFNSTAISDDSASPTDGDVRGSASGAAASPVSSGVTFALKPYEVVVMDTSSQWPVPMIISLAASSDNDPFYQVANAHVSNPWWEKDKNDLLACRLPRTWQDVAQWYWQCTTREDKAADGAMRRFVQFGRSPANTVAWFIKTAHSAPEWEQRMLPQRIARTVGHDKRCAATLRSLITDFVERIDRVGWPKDEVAKWWRNIAGPHKSVAPYSIKAHLWRSSYEIAVTSGEKQTGKEKKKQQRENTKNKTKKKKQSYKNNTRSSGSSGRSSELAEEEEQKRPTANRSDNDSKTGGAVVTRELTADEVGAAEFTLQEGEVLEITLTDGETTWLDGGRTMFVRNIELELAKMIVNRIVGLNSNQSQSQSLLSAGNIILVAGSQGVGKTRFLQFVAWLFTVGPFAIGAAEDINNNSSSSSNNKNNNNNNNNNNTNNTNTNDNNNNNHRGQSARPAICMHLSEEMQFVLFPDGVARFYSDVSTKDLFRVGKFGFIEYEHDHDSGTTIVTSDTKSHPGPLQAGQHRVLLLSDTILRDDKQSFIIDHGFLRDLPTTVYVGRPIKKLFQTWRWATADDLEHLPLWSLRELLAVAPWLATRMQAGAEQGNNSSRDNNNNNNNNNNNSSSSSSRDNNNNNNNNSNNNSSGDNNKDSSGDNNTSGNVTANKIISDIVSCGADAVQSTIISRFVKFGGVVHAIVSGDPDGDYGELCRLIKKIVRPTSRERDRFVNVFRGRAGLDDWPSQHRPGQLTLVDFARRPSVVVSVFSKFASRALMRQAVDVLNKNDPEQFELLFKERPISYILDHQGPSEPRRWSVGVLLCVLHEWGMHYFVYKWSETAIAWKMEFEPMRRKLVLFGDEFAVTRGVYYSFLGVPDSVPLSAVFANRADGVLYGEMGDIGASLATLQAAMAYLQSIASRVREDEIANGVARKDRIKGVCLLVLIPLFNRHLSAEDLAGSPMEAFIGENSVDNKTKCLLVRVGQPNLNSDNQRMLDVQLGTKRRLVDAAGYGVDDNDEHSAKKQRQSQ